jgi:uncharacterized protein YjiS (DUF1127 family)
MERAMKLLTWLRRWRRRSADRKALTQMSERELADLGIGRGELGHLLALPPGATARRGQARRP